MTGSTLSSRSFSIVMSGHRSTDRSFFETLKLLFLCLKALFDAGGDSVELCCILLLSEIASSSSSEIPALLSEFGDNERKAELCCWRFRNAFLTAFEMTLHDSEGESADVSVYAEKLHQDPASARLSPPNILQTYKHYSFFDNAC